MAKNIRLTIGEFSKFCQVTVKTLKHYEKLGLLVPNEVDEWSHYRYYDVSQMRQLNGILRLKSMGFSLEEIHDLFDEGTHKPSIPQIEEKIQKVENDINTLQNQLTTLQSMAESQKKLDGMRQFSIQSLPAIIVASHRRILAQREHLGPLCEGIIDPELQLLGCKRTQPAYCFKMVHDTEYKEENIDTEYCVQVDEMGEDSDIIHFKRLEAIPEAVCVKCYGPYRNIKSHYTEAFRYIAEHGYRVCGLPRTVYVDGSWNQKDPAKWLTIVQVPVITNVNQSENPDETFYQ